MLSHQKELQTLVNKIDADKLRMQSNLQDKLKKRRSVHKPWQSVDDSFWDCRLLLKQYHKNKKMFYFTNIGLVLKYNNSCVTSLFQS